MKRRKSVEKNKRKRSLSQMSNKEVRMALAQKSLMMSWVAYLDEEDEMIQVKYIKDALKGIETIDNEMVKREMHIHCN
jgi:hypothetical protein